MKIHQHNAGHVTKIADMPIYCKNTFSRNHWADFDETLYEVSETKALYYLSVSIAQWLERRPLNPAVVGSSHGGDIHICACHVEVKLPPDK